MDDLAQSRRDALVTVISCRAGVALSLASTRPWASIAFSGERIELVSEADLPADIDEIEVNIPGWVIADIDLIDARRLKVLVVEG